MAKKPNEKKTRTRRQKTDREKARAARRQVTPRHVIPRVELELDDTQERRILSQMKSTAYIKRRMRVHARKALEQLDRDRRWHELRAQYHEISVEEEQIQAKLDKATKNDDKAAIEELTEVLSDLKEEKGKISTALSDLQAFHKATFDDLREIASHYAAKTKVPSVFALSAAEDVWKGVEKIIYSDGRNINSKWENYASLRSKQANRAIVIKEKDGLPVFKMKDIGTIRIKDIDDDDIWLKDEINALVEFIRSKGEAEETAIDILLETGGTVSVHRPCYVTIYTEAIRGRQRFFVNIAMEGSPLPKKRKDGSPRHVRAEKGAIGVDIGPSSYAAVSEHHVEMSNIGERGSKKTRKKNQKKKAALQRKMDSSLRVNNPGNYNADGTVRKGRKSWTRSKRYHQYQEQYREICRKERLNREYGIREQVNHLRTLGSTFITEDQSVASWAKKAKPGQIGKTKSGKNKNCRRSRHGKSVQNFAPGLFTSVCKEKFGDGFVTVDKMFRASQYDHETNEYVKKPLSQRKHYHARGRASPRDAYSAFLLWCTAVGYDKPDRGLCVVRFEDYMKSVECMVADYRKRGVKVRNSGFFE